MSVLAPPRQQTSQIENWIDDDDDVVDPNNLPRGFELIDGHLVEKPKMGFESGFTSTKIIRFLGNYLDENPIGVLASSDATFACVPNRPNQVRKPDVAVILCDPQKFVPPRTNYRQAPELLIEVVSPNDTVTDLDRKVSEFLGTGTKLAWNINPELRSVTIRRADGTTSRLESQGELTGEDILPGFSLPLSRLFANIATN